MKVVTMRIVLLLALSCTLAHGGAGPWDRHGRLAVSSRNPHFLAFADGTPFFWTADTAWELFHRLDRAEADYYLRKRADQGFNLVQAVLLGELEGLTKPNAHGDLPLIGSNPARPALTPGNSPNDADQYDYWDHADFILNRAAELGLYVGVLPCWGEYVVARETKRPIFNTLQQAYGYGHFLGERYRSQPNVVWILGGDRLPDERPEGVELWRAMAEGIADGVNGIEALDGQADYSTTLMTHHCFASSSRWFHDDPWIDFHMWGSYHADFNLSRAYEEAQADWALPSPKPTLNGEPAYEGHRVNYGADENVFTAYDVRQIAYWSVLAGACGHTYGAGPVWQMQAGEPDSVSQDRVGWRTALDFPGAGQMKYLRRLMESRPILELRPDMSLLARKPGAGANHERAARGDSYAFVYLPTGYPVPVRMDCFEGRRVRAWWFDPRTGQAHDLSEFEGTGVQTFDPPGLDENRAWLQTGRACDWVLVLDAVGQHFGPPGVRPTEVRESGR
jgi:hypothetical protein